MINVIKINESKIRVMSDESAELDISEHFTFFADNYKFNPKFKARIWDGKIRLYNKRTKILPIGLLDQLISYAKNNNIEIQLQSALTLKDKITHGQIGEFLEELNLHSNGNPIEPRDFQIDAVKKVINKEKVLLLSATGSGKSLIIYSIVRWLLENDDKSKILIIVPTVGLIAQMLNDFKDYSTANGFDVDLNSQYIMGGQTKEVSKKITVSTWQSIAKLDQVWFEQFNAVIGDEAHLYAAKSLSDCMDKMVNARYRVGTTGTTKDIKSNAMTLEGHFGPITRVSSTKELMDSGILTPLKINCLLLQYKSDERKLIKGYDYKEEIDWINAHERRNKFIVNLAASMNGSTLVLFQFKEKHGIPLYESIKYKVGDTRNVYLIHGDVDAEEREYIRNAMNNEGNSITLASVQTFATGTNVPSIENIIFAAPWKGKIRILQSIGRGLRLKEGKNFCNLYDIADDLSIKSHNNITLGHASTRMERYAEEQFNFKVFQIDI